MKEIKLTQGKVTLVDDEDYDWLNLWRWQVDGKGYACRTEIISYDRSTKERKTRTIKMHRLIMDAPSDMQVDHIDRDKLKNIRSNLRLCTNAENGRNQNKQKGNWSSKYKGVTKVGEKYRARIRLDGKLIHIGYFSTEEDAGIAYNEHALKLHGEFARLNDIG